jgi:hypothetical protein
MSRLAAHLSRPHLARHGAHVLGAAALNYIALSLPSPARELVDVGMPGLSAYVACLSARAGEAWKALLHRH